MKRKNYLIVSSVVVLIILSTGFSTAKAKLVFNYDYDIGYNQSYALGQEGDWATFGPRYNNALQADRFDLAEGMLDGYNAGRSAGPMSSPGQGGGNPIYDGCKIVINDQHLTDWLNALGGGCYVNFN